ncbi:DUF342 domain-containing protein [bacterium]|nr:DUF342 domain-containing protein [bacterium]MCP5461601.1 DUF342 domain-containing protein [bacterium]
MADAQFDSQVFNEQKTTQFAVNISKDRFTATLDVYPKDGMPFDVSPFELKQILKKNGVVNGVQINALGEISRQLAQSGENIQDAVVAKGIMPIDGKDHRIEYVVDTISKSIGKRNEDGSIDYRQRESIVKVIKGQIIAYYHEATNGLDGMTVDGKVVRAQVGKSKKVELENVEYVEHEKLFKAMEDGQLMARETSIKVQTVQTIEGDVDFDSGCVDFPGTVIIKGCVLPNFYVKARGDILVNKTITDAHIESIGDVKVREGICGSHKCIIECGGSVYTNYVQNSCIICRNDVIIKKASYFSHIMAEKKIAIGSQVLGGSLSAEKEIEIKDVGSNTGGETLLEAGMYISSKNKLKQLNEQIEFCETNREKIERLIGGDICSKSREELKLLFGENFAEIEKVLDLMGQLEVQKKELYDERKKILNKASVPYPAYIKIRGTAYPGTKIVLKGLKYTVEEEMKFVRFYIDEKENRLKWTSL